MAITNDLIPILHPTLILKFIIYMTDFGYQTHLFWKSHKVWNLEVEIKYQMKNKNLIIVEGSHYFQT